MICKKLKDKLLNTSIHLFVLALIVFIFAALLLAEFGQAIPFTQYCLGNNTLYREALYNITTNNGTGTVVNIEKNISTFITCDYGCEPTTSTCAPPPGEQKLNLLFIVLPIIGFFILVGLLITRR